MANISYDSFLDKILPYARNCPDPTLEGAVRDTVIDMCERTNIWQLDLDPVSAVAEQYVYDLEPPQGSMVHKILQVLDGNGYPLVGVSLGMLDHRHPNWRNEPGTTKYYIKQGEAEIWFAPPPATAQTNAFLIRAVLKPTQSSTSADAWIMTDFRDAIVNGAISRILQMPDKDWSNFKTSAVMLSKYETQIIEIEKRARQATEGAVPILSYGGIGPSGAPRRAYERRRTTFI